MKYRKLGSTGLKVSIIGVGGGAFFNPVVNEKTVYQIIKCGVENGINLVDTAEDYGEKKLKKALNEFKDLIVISKTTSSNERDFLLSLKSSLKSLGKKSISIYLLQTINSIEDLNYRIENGVIKAAKRGIEKGLIEFLGFSSHRIDVAMEAIKTGYFDVIEIPYGVGFFETEKLFKVTKKYGIGILAIRCFGGGNLIVREKSHPLSSIFNPKNNLSYTLSNKNISSVLVGTKSVRHLEECIEAIKKFKFLSKKERKKIEKMFNKILGKNFCRGCLACMPCSDYGWKLPIDQLMRIEIFYSEYSIKNAINELSKYEDMLPKFIKNGKICESNCPYNVPIVEKIKKLYKLYLSNKK